MAGIHPHALPHDPPLHRHRLHVHLVRHAVAARANDGRARPALERERVPRRPAAVHGGRGVRAAERVDKDEEPQEDEQDQENEQRQRGDGNGGARRAVGVGERGEERALGEHDGHDEGEEEDEPGDGAGEGEVEGCGLGARGLAG